MRKILVSLIALSAAASISSAFARDTISVVGSSTLYPFATVVAERFGKTSEFKAPKIEATGSGGGLKLFCKGIGVDTPDITNASRRIKQSEFDQCRDNGVSEIVEVLVGFDGIVLANAKGSDPMQLSRKDIYLALAKQVPGPDGKLIENPHKTWREVNPALPATKIEVLGPPPTSGTRDAFAELALEGGAGNIADIEKLQKLQADQKVDIEALAAKLGIENAWKAVVAKRGAEAKGRDLVQVIGRSVREDGVYIETGENDNLIVSKLKANPSALGIFGFSFLDQNYDTVQASVIDGIAPTFETIASGDYAVSRPLYFYVKKAHIGIVPGIAEFLQAFVSEDAIGQDGYLVDRGLIPLGETQYREMADNTNSLNNLAM